MMINTYAFEVMDENNVVSKVRVANGVVTVDKFTENPAVQPFCGEKTDLARVERFLKSRCFDEKRPDAKELLGYLGLSSHNPLAIVKKRTVVCGMICFG